MSENELLDLAFDDANSRMEGAVSALERDLMVIRTGRAHTSLVDQMRVDYYGTAMALNQLATISTPEARLIAIQPWDRNAFEPITKAIQQSDIGINPQSDGILIRLALPELTEERRRDLVKMVHQRPRRRESQSATCGATSTTTCEACSGTATCHRTRNAERKHNSTL